MWRRLWKKLKHNWRAKVITITIAVLPFLLFIIPYVSYLRMERAKQELLDGKWDLQQAIMTISDRPLNELSISDFEGVEQWLIQADGYFHKAQADVKPYVPYLKFLRGDASALPHLIDLALETTQAAQDLYAGMKPLLSELLPPSRNSALYGTGADEHLTSLFLAGQPRLADARNHLTNALTASQQIDRAKLSDEAVMAMDEVDNTLPRLDSLVDALATMPGLLNDLLGSQEQKTYLVLAQNNDELRPTGGWVGTYGVLVVTNGRIVNYDYQSTQPPNLTPPNEECPVQSPPWWIQLQKPVWACWDAQWTADFPTLAQQAEWFYDKGNNPYAPVDGVIAIDLIGTGTLLSAIGQIQVPDYGESINAENMRDRIYYYRAQEGDEPHKQFIASMFKAIVKNLVALPPERTPAILQALWTSIEEKHLLFYFNSPDLESLATTLNADGGISPSQGDYLFVVDSSLTAKVYSSIAENIEYDAIINPNGSLTGQVTLDWSFPASAVQSDPAIANEYPAASGKSPDFWDFARLYIPKGSVWSGTDGNDKPNQFAEEVNKLMLGNQVIIAPGASAQIRHHYLVPDVIQKVGGRSYYRLLVQKQPGTGANGLIVRITLPPGASLLSSTPQANSVSGLSQTVIEFRTHLLTNQKFEVIFR